MFDRFFNLSGRKAIVTGAGSGIGKAIAGGLAACGVEVMATDIRFDAVEQTVADIKEAHGNAWAYETDVTKEEEVREMVAKATDKMSTVDIFFNVPALAKFKNALDLTAAEFRQVVEVTLVGTFLCAREVGNIMVRQRRGKIVNIGSIYGHVGDEKESAYAAAKGGVAQLTKVLALEWASYNVNVNAIAPGYIRTEWMAAYARKNEPWARQTEARIPLGRMGEPSDVVGAALFLVSEAAGYITGTTLFVDGGWTAR